MLAQSVTNLLAELCLQDSKAWFPGPTNDSLMHHTVSILGELGEFANIVKKIDRGDLTLEEAMSEEFMGGVLKKDTLQNELTDVFIYFMNLVGLLDFDLVAEFLKKRDYNKARWESKSD